MEKISKKDLILTINKILKNKIEKIDMGTKLINIKKWDSLNSLKLYMQLEKKTRKKLNISKLSEIETVQDIYNYFK